MSTLITDSFLFEASEYKSTVGDRKGVLRTIKGPLAEWGNKNRNKRVYSEGIWDKVLESDYVKEQLKHRSLFGEANHPQGRFEVDFSRVSHAVVEMHKDPKEKILRGTIDILDTPLGRILDVLYEYKSVLGVSSRAGGVLNKKKDYIEVDEDSYQFITFDIVPYPSVEKARLISEGVEIPDEDRVQLSEEAHKKLIDIIQSTTGGSREALKEFIYEVKGFDLDNEVALLEGMTFASEGDDSFKKKDSNSMKDTTLCLLKESYLQKAKLTSENRDLARKIKELTQSYEEQINALKLQLNESGDLKEKTNAFLQRHVKEVKVLREGFKNVAQERDFLKKEVERLQNTIFGSKSFDEERLFLSEELAYYKEKCRNLEKVLNNQSHIVKSYDSVVNELNTFKQKVGAVNENGDLQKEYDEVVRELGNAAEELCEARSAVDEALKEIENLREEGSHNNSLVKSLEEDISEQKALLKTKTGEIILLKENLSLVNSEKEDLIKEKSSIIESYQRDLVKVIASSYGLSEDLVLQELGEGEFYSGDIYIVCEKISSSKSSAGDFKLIVDEITDDDYKKNVGDKNVRLNSSFINRRGI